MPTKQEYKKAQGTTSENKKRAQLDHLLIDVDFFDKPKIKCLAYEHGQLSVLFLIRIYTALSRATDARIKKTICSAIAYEMRIEKEEAERVISYFISEGLLDSDGDFVESHRVSKDQEALFIKRKKWRNAKESDEKDAGSGGGKSEEGGDFREQLNTEQLNTECIHSEGVQGEIVPQIPFPELDTPEIRDALKLWARKSAKNGRPIDEITLVPLCMRFKGRPEQFKKALIYSSSLSKCFNVVEAPSDSDPPHQKKSRGQLELEQKLKAIAEF